MSQKSTGATGTGDGCGGCFIPREPRKSPPPERLPPPPPPPARRDFARQKGR